MREGARTKKELIDELRASRARVASLERERVSEAYSRSLFEHMPSGVAVYETVDDGEDFVFVDFNPAAEKIEKISKEDLIGKRVTEAFPEVESFGIFAVFQRVWTSGQPEYFPERLYEDQRDPGTWRENWVYKLPCGRIVAIYNNVTERKRAEQLLRDSEERLELAMQGAGLGMWDHDLQTGQAVRSRRWAEMLGYSPDEIANNTDAWKALIHPDDRVAVDEAAREHETGRTRVFQVEHRMRTKSGEWKWILNWGKVVERDRNGAPLRASGIHLDITERKRVEQALLESEAILNETGEMARVGGWKHDLKTGEAVWTRALYDIIEVESGPPPGVTEHLDYYAPEHRRVLEQAYRRAVNEGAPFDLELQARTAKGRPLWCRVHGEPVMQAGECVAMHGTFQDITGRKQAEEARLRLEEQLRQSQKMEAVGTLAAGVAHDFNNSLTAILGHAEIARDSIPPNHRALADIDGVISAANQATGITQGLLTFSRETAAEMKPLDLARLVWDSSRTLRRMLPAAIEVTIDAPETSAAWIEGEAVHLNQVLMNLVVNARDAMPDGGPLLIRVRHEDSSPFDAWSAVETHGRGFAVLTVADSGHGMSPEVRAKVFDPFFSTKSRGKGTGLGMSVVHGIVEEHRGHIEIDTEEGRGTRMTIGFPCCGGREPERKKKPETPASGVGRTILLAEDNPQVQSVIAAALESAGYEVIRADDGEQALTHYQRESSRIDLAVLDVDMPRLDGKACLARIRESNPNFPAVMVTGFYDAVSGYEDLPHTAVMRKPCALADLKRRIGELIASSTAKTEKQS